MIQTRAFLSNPTPSAVPAVGSKARASAASLSEHANSTPTIRTAAGQIQCAAAAAKKPAARQRVRGITGGIAQ
ncbi:hypothetical protein [Puniceibacterium sediminis]|uniref:Uncharacterized protein n=1 Tax=Puniceibacterium sediminis TaxID=1608407 RepID=A0A238Y3H0_9RHOB|nr:hypothetical protein [Puniceibacterium sediminis]SNR65826.1 hypothetical protein SAMN06265370_114103 [Puniceibacterium sediminis]